MDERRTQRRLIPRVVKRCAKVPLDLMHRELDRWTLCGAGGDLRDNHVDEFALGVAAMLKDDFGYERVRDGGSVEVGAALKAMRGIRVQPVTARRPPDAHGIEPRRFDKDVFGLRSNHGVPAAHHSSEADGLFL